MTKQHPNAFAYVIYERPSARLVKEGVEIKWIRSLMFYADDPSFSSRDAVWEHHIDWRDPDNIRVKPLFDGDALDARRDTNLDDINARYQADTNVSLASAVETALDKNPPSVKSFEGLVRILQVFDHRIQLPLAER